MCVKWHSPIPSHRQVNPLIVARPPSAISESDLETAPYYCPHGPGAPFEQCVLIDNFFAGEALAYPDTPTKVIMVAQRCASVSLQRMRVRCIALFRLFAPQAKFGARRTQLNDPL